MEKGHRTDMVYTRGVQSFGFPGPTERRSLGPHIKYTNTRLGTVAHVCNPSTLGGRGRQIMRSRHRDHPGQHGETPSLPKNTKISWAWWCAPVIPATRVAEAGELLEPRRRRLQ